MGLLTKVEEILNIPMDLFHSRKGFHPVDLSRMALRCMEQGSRKGINKTYAPNSFTVLLSPADHRDLFPFISTIHSDILHELKKVVTERGYLLAGELFVELLAGERVEDGLPQVTGRMEGRDEPDSHVSFSGSEQITGERIEKKDQGRFSAEPITMLEEGVTLLREGEFPEALEMLAKVEQDLDDVPQFQAAMAVVNQMQGKQVQAEEHLAILGDLSIPQLPWKEEGVSSVMEYRLESDIPGVSLLVGPSGIQLENRYRDPSAKVDNKVEPLIEVREGKVIILGTQRLHLSRNRHAEKE